MTQDEAKALVGKRAAEMVESGMAVGLGTGSTSRMFIEALGERVKQGLKIKCVASSDASHQLGLSLGMKVFALDKLPKLDIYVDGADEISLHRLALVKGGGGALFREKTVAKSADRFIVVVDSSKVVQKLGAFPLPLEVVKSALPLVTRQLQELDLNPRVRKSKTSKGNWITDEGNLIVDCAWSHLGDRTALAARLDHMTGVLEHGLFLGMASLALVAGEDGVTEMKP